MEAKPMHDFDRCRILVVGGAGFVGSNLAHALLQHSTHQVIVVDNLLSAERVNVPDDARVHFIEASITHDEVLARLPNDLDYAFHLATFHGNQNSIADPLADHENNTLTSLKLFDRLKSIKSLRRVVYSSAGCTVAEKTFDKAEATTEDAPVSLYLDSPYQISKIIGEFYGNYYFKLYGLPIVKARFQNVYGPGEILGAGQWRGTSATVWRNVTPSFVYRALKGMPLRIEHGGVATRDFIYASDIANGLMACAARGEAGGTYNLASGRETSILELAELINELTGNRAGLEVAPKRAWDHSGKRYGSVDKAQRTLGFSAATELREGLEKTIAWTCKNLAMIDACIARHQPRLQAAA
jgi:nucleoside-diphosphate-sugar epimerase